MPSGISVIIYNKSATSGLIHHIQNIFHQTIRLEWYKGIQFDIINISIGHPDQPEVVESLVFIIAIKIKP